MRILNGRGCCSSGRYQACFRHCVPNKQIGGGSGMRSSQGINSSSGASKAFAASAWGRLSLLGRSVRVHQWAKNVLVFVPLCPRRPCSGLEAWIASLVGFVGISLTCSASYSINDLWDLENDRRHRSKRWRPLPNGELRKYAAVAMAAAGLTLGLLLSASLGLAAVGVLLGYLAITLSYTFFLKRVPIVDVFVIASLFTLRLVFGM